MEYAVNRSGESVMKNNYSSAIWLSIAAAIVFPLAFIVQGLTGLLFGMEYTDQGVGYTSDPSGIFISNILFMLFAAIAVFSMIKFKQLLFDQFSFKKLNPLIYINIFWHFVFFLGSFLLEFTLIPFLSGEDLGPQLVLMLFWGFGVAVFGIIDILIGAILYMNRNELKSSLKIFAVISLIMGLLEITVVLAPITLFIVPLYFVSLAYVFYQGVEEVEIV